MGKTFFKLKILGGCKIYFPAKLYEIREILCFCYKEMHFI